MGLHKSIKLSFLTVGHTKFSPDWCFGLLKQRFCRTKVDCLDDIVRVVETSAAINHTQLVGTQSGETVVPTFNWAEFLSSLLKRVPHIKRLQHFQFTSEDLGTVIVKRSCDSEEERLDLMISQPSVEDFPELDLPSGLSDARQRHLFQKIRDFCSDETKDIVCPLPSCPPTSATSSCQPVQQSLVTSPPNSSTSLNSPPPKRQRMCGHCGQTGHNIHTCEQAAGLAKISPSFCLSSHFFSSVSYSPLITFFFVLTVLFRTTKCQKISPHHQRFHFLNPNTHTQSL